MQKQDRSVETGWKGIVRPSAVLGLVAFALVYWLATRLSFYFVVQPASLAGIWPASGIGLAALLLSERRHWGGLLGVIFAVNVISNLSSGNSLPVCAAFAFANTLEPALGAWVFTRWQRDRITFSHLRDVYGLVIVAVGVNAVTASIGALVPSLILGAPYGQSWLVWWIADGLGILLLTPLIVTWARGELILSPMALRRRTEIVAWLVLLCATGWYVFGTGSVSPHLAQRPYMLFPVLIWAALRYSPRVSANALVLICAIALGATAAGLGIFPLGGETLADRLVAVQAFFCVASIAMLLLAVSFTEGRQTEAAMRDANIQLAATLNALPDLLFEVDRDGIIYDFRAPHPELLYISPEQFMGKSMLDVLPIEAADTITRALAQAVETGHHFGTVYSLQVPQGLCWFELSIAVKGNLNSPDARFITLVRDITDRKQAEEKLSQSARDLNQAQQYSHVGSWVWKIKENKLEWSDEMFRIFGIDKETFTGDLASVISAAIHPDDRQAVEASNLSVIQKNKPIPLEYRIIRPDGTVRYVWAEAGELEVDESGKASILRGYVQDITERKKSEIALQEAQSRLIQSEKLAAIGKLVAGVAHELNNPLTSVVLFSQILQQRSLDEQMRSDLGKVVSESMRAAKIVRGLLDFARQRPVELKPLQVNSLLKENLDMLAYELSTCNIRYSLRLAPDLPLAMVDAHQMGQVFLNLITNAWQAIASVQSAGSLIISSEVGHSEFHGIKDISRPVIRIAFEDDGPGIPEALLSRVFDPFFSTKSEGQGTGLGLSICHGIVAGHGGHIWVENCPLGGARFVIELPVASPGLAGTEAADLIEVSQKAQTQVSVLIIDDEPALLEVLARALSGQGYQVTVENEGNAALARLQQQSYDLIVCDIRLPGMSGGEIYHRVKEFNLRLAQRMLFITGDVVSPATREFLEQTGVPYLSKPFDLEHLLFRLSQMLEQNNWDKENQ
jgi:PAS domain S-box-containing protein